MAGKAMTSITLDTPSSERVSQNLGILTGLCDFGAADGNGFLLTEINAAFKTVLSVTLAGNDGYIHQWDKADALIRTFEAGGDGAALDEVAAGDVGECTFVAFGII